MSKNLSLIEIEKLLCAYYKISAQDLSKRTRKREVVMLRQQAHYFSVIYVNTSLQKIGDYFGRHDHSTVLHSCKVVNNLCVTDKAYRDDIEILTQRLIEMNARRVIITPDEIRTIVRKAYNKLMAKRLRELKHLRNELNSIEIIWKRKQNLTA